jgi:hypothetical protein
MRSSTSLSFEAAYTEATSASSTMATTLISIGTWVVGSTVIRASYLTIFHALFGKQLDPNSGPYDVPGLGPEGTQLRFSRGTPDFRWAGYCIKGVAKARPMRRRYMRWLGLREDRRWVAQFEGKAITARTRTHKRVTKLEWMRA